MKRLSKFAALSLVQWKHQRNELMVFTVVAAALVPLAHWQSLTLLRGGPRSFGSVVGSGIQLGAYAPAFLAALAAIIGVLLATRAFDLDDRAKHAYPLSLPMTRQQYALGRIGSALTCALLPTLGTLIGALVAVQGLSPSSNMRAFPVGLALRFLLAIITAFSIGFALRYGLGRRMMRVIIIAAATIGIAEVVTSLLFEASVVRPLIDFVVMGQFSPLRVFFVDWKLFDA